MSKRIYISGASGSGVSTLGAALAARLQVLHIDVDDYYWYPTEPPFVQSRHPAQRVALLMHALADGPWVLSGSLDGWGDEIIQRAGWVVFVDTPTPLRIERLRSRESQRYGERILRGGDMHANYQAFLTWAEGYDSGAQAGRSRPRHELWLKQLTLRSIRVSGEMPVESLLEEVIATVLGLGE